MQNSPILAAIPFPGIDPVALQLGPLQIHWYGVGYVVGILFGWWYARRLVSNEILWGNKPAPIKKTDIDDFLTWCVIGIIFGGRLGYILFYDLAAYLQSPGNIMAVWKGGMSFHGGLIGVLIAMILFARRKGFSPFSLFDVITPSATIGIMAVRIANFINAELYGKPTKLAWGVVFPGAGNEPRHPSQLYEAALEGLILFVLLRLATHKFLKLTQPGFVAGLFILWYAFSRILIEFVRIPDAHIGYLAGGWLTMGMILSLPLALVGLWAIATSAKRR